MEKKRNKRKMPPELVETMIAHMKKERECEKKMNETNEMKSHVKKEHEKEGEKLKTSKKLERRKMKAKERANMRMEEKL